MEKKKATTIYLVRHGEVHNPEKILYGRMPGFGLSETGKKQAAALGKFLSSRPLSAIYSSPLQRTQETAKIAIVDFPSLKIAMDDRFIEVKTPWEGKPLAELDAIRFNFYQDHSISQGGETINDIYHRMAEALTELANKHEGEEIVTVSHGDPIMIIRAYYQGQPLELSSLREGLYVEHAKGIKLTYGEGNVTVENLEFTI